MTYIRDEKSHAYFMMVYELISQQSNTQFGDLNIGKRASLDADFV